ncbi:MAG: helix-turn-helix domain-containing protein [Nanoarchaeota archaeon]|nr:helix-turn-helix domain-containing protein [Nanoarchaeota archaeon]
MTAELKRMGENFRCILNDLKRRPQDAAKDLEVQEQDIMDIIEGKTALSHDIVEKATKVWPVNARDFFLLNDDCPTGLKIMRKEESEKSARIMDRGGAPYYEYRDTVASSLALFRPEWIQEECFVEDNDPENPKVQWNNGHFMHQFTYFRGHVNFYYRDQEGNKQVFVTETGDSMYITPFVPHTFTTRNNPENKKGLILALTYGNKVVGEAQQELSALGKELSSQFALNFTSKEKACGDLITFYKDGASISSEELAKRADIPKERLASYEEGATLPEISQVAKIASALSINTKELLPFDEIEKKVITQKHSEGKKWMFADAYEMISMAQTKSLPNSKAIECTIIKEGDRELDIKNGLHQYIYNVGKTPVKVFWEKEGQQYEETINQDDSCYIEPFVPHCFRGKGKIIILRIGGRIAGGPQIELSLIGKGNSKRAIGETLQWFNPNGKS